MFAGGQCCPCQTDVSIRWSSVDLLEGPSTPWHINALGPPLQGTTGEANVGGMSTCSLGADSGLHLVGVAGVLWGSTLSVLQSRGDAVPAWGVSVPPCDVRCEPVMSW